MPPNTPDAPNTNVTTTSPLNAYRQAIAHAGFIPDEAQSRAAALLDACHNALHQPSLRSSIIGVYLWGPVGRGKTWLLDAFHSSLHIPARRQHFHHFMRWVHQRLFQLTGTTDPLLALARELAHDVRVLCFDELFVSDIGDAMLLGRLFQELFVQGVVIVATSNQPPQQLYAEGFNRQRFMPAITAIEKHMQIIEVDGGQDHRLHVGLQHQRYFVKQPEAIAAVFERLVSGESIKGEIIKGGLFKGGRVELGSRTINSLGFSNKVLWCRFADLCQAPLSAMDFIVLCDRFSVILLSEVPALSGKRREGRIARGTEDGVEQVQAGDRILPDLAPNDDSVRRFIALVDECYDRRVPLYIDAAVALEALYTEGFLEFPFRRTLSRLQEMQLQRFSSGGF